MKEFELTHQDILDVVEGLNLIAEVEPPAAIRTKIARISRVFRPEAEIVTDGRKSILDKFAVFEGEGENRRYKLVVNQKTGEPVPNTVQLTDRNAFLKEEKAFFNTKVQILSHFLTEEELEQLKITVRAQELLMPICTFGGSAPTPQSPK